MATLRHLEWSGCLLGERHYREHVFDGEDDDAQQLREACDRSTSEREQLVGSLDEPPLFGQEAPPRPERRFVMSDPAELVEALDEAVLLRRLVQLVDYIGDGRPVDGMV